jgi:hypothetical protein
MKFDTRSVVFFFICSPVALDVQFDLIFRHDYTTTVAAAPATGDNLVFHIIIYTYARRTSAFKPFHRPLRYIIILLLQYATRANVLIAECRCDLRP